MEDNEIAFRGAGNHSPYAPAAIHRKQRARSAKVGLALAAGHRHLINKPHAEQRETCRSIGQA